MKRSQGISDSSEHRTVAASTPPRPYEHTLTPADRMVLQRWLVGTSAFWGVVTLLIIGIAIVGHDRTGSMQAETAAAVLSGTPGRPTCLGHSKRDTRLVRKQAGTNDDAFLGCI
jgi:hypothetical protein